MLRTNKIFRKLKIKHRRRTGVVAHAYNLSTLGGGGGQITESGV